MVQTRELWDFLIQLMVIVAISLAIFRQDMFIKFEQNAWRFIKAFVFALRDVIKDKMQRRCKRTLLNKKKTSCKTMEQI